MGDDHPEFTALVCSSSDDETGTTRLNLDVERRKYLGRSATAPTDFARFTKAEGLIFFERQKALHRGSSRLVEGENG